MPPRCLYQSLSHLQRGGAGSGQDSRTRSGGDSRTRHRQTQRCASSTRDRSWPAEDAPEVSRVSERQESLKTMPGAQTFCVNGVCRCRRIARQQSQRFPYLARLLPASSVAQYLRAHPVGDPFAVRHYHSRRKALSTLGLGSFEISVGTDRLVYSLMEAISSEVWVTHVANVRAGPRRLALRVGRAILPAAAFQAAVVQPAIWPAIPSRPGKLVLVATTLPAWSQHLISELETADARVGQLARPLTRQQLNWSPAPGAWSIGQCLEHLLITNELYLPAISMSLDGRHPSEVQEVTLSRFSRWCMYNYIGPSNGKRAKAPRKIRPAAEVETSVLDAFLRSNDIARALIARASAYDVNRIRFKDPLLSLLRFTAGAGLEMVSQHESRHLLQAERVRQSSSFPRGDAALARYLDPSRG